MQKVKVQRYISGKRPEYAQYDSSEDSDDDDFIDRKTSRNYSQADESYARQSTRQEYIENVDAMDDPRLRRMARNSRLDGDERMERHRHIHEPEIIDNDEREGGNRDDRNDDDDYDEDDDNDNSDIDRDTAQSIRNRRIALGSDSDSEAELSDTEIEKRRQRLRHKMLQQRKEEEILLKEDEEKKSEQSDSDSSEYEEETDSEEDNEPRLKPLFVRKRDRATIAEKEKEAIKQKQLEHEAKKMAKERRRNTLRLVEESVKKDLEKTKVCIIYLYIGIVIRSLCLYNNFYSQKAVSQILTMYVLMMKTMK